MFNLIGFLIIGLLAGALAKFLMPGKDPGGCVITLLLGIGGSFAAGFLGASCALTSALTELAVAARTPAPE